MTFHRHHLINECSLHIQDVYCDFLKFVFSDRIRFTDTLQKFLNIGLHRFPFVWVRSDAQSDFQFYPFKISKLICEPDIATLVPIVSFIDDELRLPTPDYHLFSGF